MKGPPRLRPRIGRRPREVRVGDVWIGRLDAERPYPTVVRPACPGLPLTNWAAGNRILLERWLLERRSLLFRGFELGGIEGFSSFVRATSDGEPLPYRDRSTPRTSYGKNVYCTTIFPPEHRIRLHNEGSYWKVWALKAYFACITAPRTGGATPIGDVHAVWRRIDPDLREEFDRKGILYVRNYNDGFGLPWQEVFQTEDRREVESYCRANDIEVEWKPGGRLRTRTHRPAIRNHPRTGEPLWFNHAAFFHPSALEPSVRAVMEAELGSDGLPYQTFFGDGSEIPEDAVAHILDAYDAEETSFPWEPGDVHWIDNMRLAHARQPYTGDRLILVALTEPCSGDG